MYGFYYHAISYRDFEGFYFCGGIFFATIRIRGLLCEQIQGKKSYKQNNLPLYDQGLLQTWEVLKQAQAMGSLSVCLSVCVSLSLIVSGSQ